MGDDATLLSIDESEDNTERCKSNKQKRFAEHDAERGEGNIETVQGSVRQALFLYSLYIRHRARFSKLRHDVSLILRESRGGSHYDVRDNRTRTEP